MRMKQTWRSGICGTGGRVHRQPRASTYATRQYGRSTSGPRAPSSPSRSTIGSSPVCQSRTARRAAPTSAARPVRIHEGRGRAASATAALTGGTSAGRSPLGGLEHLDDAQRAGTARERLRARADALDEVRRGQLERLRRGGHLDRAALEARNRDHAAGVAHAAVERVLVERERALLEAALVGEHALAADDRHPRGLLGVEPAQVDVGRDPALELEVAHDHVRDAGLEVTVLVEAHVDDGLGHQVEQDRDVVRGGVPPHVRVALDASHAEALEGEVQETAEGPRVDEALHLTYERVVEEGLVDEE